MLKKILQAALTLIRLWRKDSAEQQAASEVLKKDLSILAHLTEIEHTVDDTIKEKIISISERRAKMGLPPMLALLFLLMPYTAQAQDAATRIQTYTHEELRDYSTALVDLSNDQQVIIKELQARNEALLGRLEAIDKKLETLTVTPNKPSKLAKVGRWISFVVPFVALIR